MKTIYITHPITGEPLDKSQCKRVITQMAAEIKYLKEQLTEVQAAIDRTVAAPVRILKNYPKSLEDVDSGPDLYCPECDEELDGYENFCPICGQKLDWEFGNGID